MMATALKEATKELGGEGARTREQLDRRNIYKF
jgi:hypothetical protein